MSKRLSTLLGFDFGMKHIGVAVGQTLTRAAKPLAVLHAQHGTPNWDELATLLLNWHPDAFVVGIPLNMDGTEQYTTHAARHFSRQLKRRFDLPVFEVDECLTTHEAKMRHRHTTSPTRSKQNARMDSYAAQIILESWLANHPNETES